MADLPPLARPLPEWHEEMGPVTWWKLPVEEPAWIGTPYDSDWPGYHTHFTPHPEMPRLPPAADPHLAIYGRPARGPKGGDKHDSANISLARHWQRNEAFQALVGRRSRDSGRVWRLTKLTTMARFRDSAQKNNFPQVKKTCLREARRAHQQLRKARWAPVLP